MTPKTREEFYLAAAGGQDVNIPAPITRKEVYLAKIAGLNVNTPDPITREEMFLARLAGQSVSVPAPKTRYEMFLASKAGTGVEMPQPITRYEMFLAGIKTETEHEEEVQGAEINITNAVGGKPIALSIEIPVQMLGSGTPSPENIREIVTGNRLVLTVNGAASTITLQSSGDTVAGGMLDLQTGGLTVTHLAHTFTGNDTLQLVGSGSYAYVRLDIGEINYAKSSTPTKDGWCSHLKTDDISGSVGGDGYRVLNSPSAGRCYLALRNTTLTNTVAAYNTWLAAQYDADTPVRGAYTLMSAVSATLTIPTITLESGANTIKATIDGHDAGTITMKYMAR